MPIYEYKCPDCGHRFEKIQPISAGHHLPCPRCAAEADRIISLSGFILKGTGWYVTDHPSKDRKAALRSERKPVEKSTSSTPPAKPKSEKSVSTSTEKSSSSGTTE